MCVGPFTQRVYFLWLVGCIYSRRFNHFGHIASVGEGRESGAMPPGLPPTLCEQGHGILPLEEKSHRSEVTTPCIVTFIK